MQLVGPDLGKLRRSLIDKSDVKAPNFATGLGTESGVIYMLDFGFARKYKFYDQPPYTLFQSLIEQAAKKLRITLHEPFDWQVNARVLKKGEFVGELGESNLASMKMGEEEEETDTSVDTMPIDIET
ncbi:hypothetical protein Y032_0250g136 [Ancylostoma ceylanicum]|uniref:Protein kinase domain-containing protein n=1 Tax=Ancylostoma ceylanicum TaxID=53326 RepID=A0A016SCX4_9BILA|nr:hypothetical protein Y032_0250g136 [Ancylostoma ceylanicum]